MHQQQWLAVIDELGGAAALPISNSFPQAEETQEYSYAFFATATNGAMPPPAVWNNGPAPDGKGSFAVFQNVPMGDEPVLGPARADSGAQNEQIR
jgi:Mn-containing catalase